MQQLVALFAGCLLHPPGDDPCAEARQAQAEFLRSHDAREVAWHANGTVSGMKATGILLKSGMAGLELEDSAPQILEAIGPALLARGTEELRIRFMSRGPTKGELTVKLDEYIDGRRAQWAGVNVVVKEETNEVTAIYANFMPDRGLDHQPRLSAMEARFKVEAIKDERLYFSDWPAQLGYEFEKIESSTIFGGALVWTFNAPFPISVDAATGRIIRMYPPPLHDP